MNVLFLDKYCAYHLEDIGLNTPSNLLEFKGCCTKFLEDLKSADHELYCDVMTMSIPKQVNLIRDIYDVNHIRSIDEILDDIALYDEELAEAIRLDTAELELSINEASDLSIGEVSKTIGNRVLTWFLKTLNTIFDKDTGPAKIIGLILLLVGVGAGIKGLIGYTITTSFGIISTLAVIAMYSVLILGIVVLATSGITVGENRLTLLKLAKTKYKKFMLEIQNKAIPDLNTKEQRAIALLLRSDMRSCLKSNLNSIATQTVKDIVVFDLFTRDRGVKPGTTPAEVTADNILKCSLTYLTNTIAEMYSSLATCLSTTRGGVSAPSNITALSPDLAKISFAPECQSIRDGLDLYVSYFNDLVSIAFKSDSGQRNYWKQTLNEHVNRVMKGQHASPIKNAERGVPKRFSKVAIKFDPTRKPKSFK